MVSVPVHIGVESFHILPQKLVFLLLTERYRNVVSYQYNHKITNQKFAWLTLKNDVTVEIFTRT